VERVDNLRQKRAEKPILGIFAKQPLAGQVKTRLCPPLSRKEAAELYRVSLSETVERMQQGRDYDLMICYAGERSWFEAAFPGVGLYPQQGADLGRRMADALEYFFDQGYGRAALIGSDSPDLPGSIIAQAFEQLNYSDLVLGPAVDGGYYLVGESRHCPALFENIPWSSETVLELTLQKATAFDVATVLLKEWEDLDDFASLKRFLERQPESRTSRFMKQFLWRYFEE